MTGYAHSADKTWLLGSPVFGQSGYIPGHPLEAARVGHALGLIQAMGWVSTEQYIECTKAKFRELMTVHTVDYLQALIKAEQALASGEAIPPSLLERYNLQSPTTGSSHTENPVFPGMFTRHATAAGGTLLGARMLQDHGTVFHPGGGSHHAHRDHAKGFCYLSDIALGINEFLRQSHDGTVVYIDLDLHQADGPQSFYEGNPRAKIISIHHDKSIGGRGNLGDTGTHGNFYNIPVRSGLTDADMVHLVKRVIMPLVESFSPYAIVVQCGVDGLADDPCSKFSQFKLSNHVHPWAVKELQSLSPRLLVLGGGSYNPLATARCWSYVWALLSGHEPQQPLTPEAAIIVTKLYNEYPKLNTRLPRSIMDQSDGRNGAVNPYIQQLADDIRQQRGIKPRQPSHVAVPVLAP